MIADIRELISLDDVMEEYGLGPNGALMYCMEYPSLVFSVFLHSQTHIILSCTNSRQKGKIVLKSHPLDILKKIWMSG